MKSPKNSTNEIISHNQNKQNILNILPFYIFNIAYGFYLIKIILNNLYNNQIIKITNNSNLHTYIKKFFLLEKINLINNHSIILFIFLTIIFILYIYFINKKNLKINQLSFAFQQLIIIQGLYYFIFNNNRIVMITTFLYIITLLYNFISSYNNTNNNYSFCNKLFKHIAIFIYILLGSISIFSLFLIKKRIMLYLFIIAISSDIFAFLGGYFWGKKLLCPNISPKKTKEGFCFGILCTIIIINIIFNNPKKTSFYIIFFILNIINSIIAQIGDLIVSKFKRNLKIKDFGTIIPEHGGLLDRFDSILFLSIFTILIIINPFSQIIHQLLLMI
ncbi:MAG: phosphatidate cytidylyltransferase [Pigeon pea little leaf phytoplasma]|uniref:Phosphatidate cytidylyltransferase n=1 Tax=Candidatus Phytoplasma fabacearum TaxID=2982628 RepID=A0ABU8ZRT4_9MOLU|nr:phosphatidate cytidylyltransferase ['Bituminaria bituminosa' little leaf phytoplasma]MDV3154006.1 phosphatidate cytidylyltransferase [Pigeon pea little leaf phytoplasma]MDO7983476.1 phosphatidate cytidylyltransferase ['Bituminaria bituminosa' little leaf phytoplasma]MDO8023897.1 phosphatidate cytidylyltransferase ['Bituminaria bituminosa' little leaf phytoplasma]MDO8030492.1 phosphatidate cytidylyltransferase ['Bituminaria bituminosa' little leaf phytoplasma]MDV3158494.1 phosphatidate cytid